MSAEPKPPRIETTVVHAGERRPGPEGSVVFPIYQGTVFTVEPDSSYDDIRYIRLNTNPTQAWLHDKLAALEGAEAALATASGMAALSTILLTFLRTGDHVLVGGSCYGGTHSFFTRHASDLGWTHAFIDAQHPASWKDAVRPETRLLLLETITNPLMRVPRLREAVDFARAHGLVTVIDNTLASPVNFRPLELGFDLSFHSATKYLNGHSDLVAGAVMGPARLVERVRKTLNHLGGSLDPHAAYLLGRGVKTLCVRVEAQNRNALVLARELARHPGVLEVQYPGLESHPDHGHARELLRGFGGMLSFRPRGGAAAAERLLRAVTLPYPAPSLGGVESLITRPSTTSHAGLTPEERAAMGVTDDLVRVSCGIEHADDLVADFRQALDKAAG